MSRISAYMDQLAQQGKKALIPFMTAGDPHPDWTVNMMHTLVGAGCDILELGVPFSDPMADGPVIQRASERALAHGVGLNDVLHMVATFRTQNQTTPVVLMGYLNPVEVMGYETFAHRAAQAGVDGVLTVDMPPEEAQGLLTTLRAVEIDPIFLMAPTTHSARLQKIIDVAAGYLYYVSLKGVTGSNKLDGASVCKKVAEIKRMTALPVSVGFGIKDAQTAKSVAHCADGVVVGSALVAKAEAYPDDLAQLKLSATQLMAEIRQALDE